jgi:hypothetical protein
MAVERTIVLTGNNYGHHDECVLDGACLPGTAVALKSNGNYDQIAAALAASLKEPSLWILKEDRLQGRYLTTTYNSGDRAFMYKPVRGDHLLLLVVSGQNIAVGDLLVEVAGGSGKFNEAAGTETRFRAKALEAPGALAADTLVKCEWL